MIEPRPYGPDLSDAEREEILSLVTSPKPGLVVYRELVVQTPFTMDLLHDRLEALVADHPTFVIVLDLSACNRPDAATRATLRQRVSRIVKRVDHLAIVIGSNIFVSAMARLLAYSMNYRSVSVHDDLASAVAKAERALVR